MEEGQLVSWGYALTDAAMRRYVLGSDSSRYNTDRRLASLLKGPQWVFSSNGANNTKHPHLEAVARVLHYGKGVETLYFNYYTDFKKARDDDELKEQHGYAPDTSPARISGFSQGHIRHLLHHAWVRHWCGSRDDAVKTWRSDGQLQRFGRGRPLLCQKLRVIV